MNAMRLILPAKMDSGKFRRSAVRLPDKIDHACFRFVASFNRSDKLLRSPPPVGDGDSSKITAIATCDESLSVLPNHTETYEDIKRFPS